MTDDVSVSGSPANGPRNGNGRNDPSRNVLDLVDAAIKRMDDLAAAAKERADDLRESSIRHITEMANLRAAYDSRLRGAETARIDAIRAVDVGNVQRAAEVQAAAALALANQVTVSADALRTQVATTATAFDAKLTLALEPIQKRIDDLSRAQYEQQGVKAQVTESRESTGSSRQGSALAVAIAVGVAGVLIGLGGLIFAIVK